MPAVKWRASLAVDSDPRFSSSESSSIGYSSAGTTLGRRVPRHAVQISGPKEINGTNPYRNGASSTEVGDDASTLRALWSDGLHGAQVLIKAS